jgi:gliding motility-associated-like protein
MKPISTRRMFKKLLSLLALIAITLFGAKSYAQTKNYATVTPSSNKTAFYTLLGIENEDPGAANAGTIVNPGNAAIITPFNPATLTANYFNVLGLYKGEGEVSLQMKFASPLVAGKTTFIPFAAGPTGGLNLDLLGIVGDLTGLLSSNVIQVDAYTGATALVDGSRINTGVSTTVVRDAAGQNYFAVTSASAYNAVRVRLRYRGNLLGLALGSSVSINLFTPFSYDAGNCGPAAFTDIGEATGLNVSLTALIQNPQLAIDGDPATFAQVQSGLVALGSNVSQTFYLPYVTQSNNDVAKIILSQPGTLLSLDVLKTIRIQAYNGNTEVGSIQSANNLLTLQLLGLFSNDRQFTVYYTPNAPFDRIRVTIDNGVAVGGNILSGGIKIHEVQRTVTKPAFAGAVGGAQTICGGSNLVLSAQNANAAFTYNFYKKVNNVPVLLAGNTAGTTTETGLAPGTYTYYVAAVKAGCTAESDRDSVLVTVNPILLLATTSLPNGAVNKVYSKQITAATGGSPAYTYALATGSTLPAGLTLTSGGLINGTPSASGTLPFSITATDSFGCTATTSYTVTIAAVLVLPPAILPNGTVGIAYTGVSFPVPSGGTTPYSYTAVNMPPGLTVNAAGLIVGTPTQSGTFTFPATVTDADGNTVTTNFTIIIRNPLTLASSALSDGTTGVTYPIQIIPAATGGSGIYSYTATDLPPGLSFNPGSREITGIPTQSGPFTVKVDVSDNEGKSAIANYTVTIKDPLVLGPKVLANGTVGVTYPAETIPAATGGTGPYTYTGSNLPPGLTFNTTTRQIAGVPSQSGTFNLMVQVTDALGATVSVPYAIKVIGALDLPAATLASGKVGTAYNSGALPVLTGGTPPYTYVMTNLPAGLNFNTSTRVISGTPALGGSFTVTMRGTDNAGLTTTTDYLLNITVGAPTIAGVTVCGGSPATLTVSNTTTGVTYNFYSATGNTPIAVGASYSPGALNETTTFYVEAVSGTAVSARVPVTITVNPSPELPVIVTNNLTMSTGQTATLQATSASGATIKWFAAATGGAALATGPTYTTPVLTASATYYAGTESSSGCASLSRVPVTVNVTSDPSNPNCNAAVTQQSSITGLLCIGCSIQGAGNSVDADLTNYTQISLLVGAGSTGYQRLIFRAPGAATDSVRVDLETPVGLADLSALGGITLNVMNGNSVVRSYPINPALISLSLLGGNKFQATVLAGGIYDRVEVRFNPVVAALSNLRIYGATVIYPNPTIVSGSQTICSGSTASLSVTPQGGTDITWYSAATNGNILANGNTYTTAALTATTTYYIQVSKNGCANPSRVPVTVTVTPAVNAPVLATIAPVCSGSTAVLAIDNPQTGTTYNWYTAATGGTPVFSGAVYTLPGVNANATYYVEAANGNCISATRTAATIVVNPRPVLPQIQASATAVNQGQTVQLTATSSETDVVFNWYNSADATTPVYTGATYITPPITATTTFYLEATSTITGCASSARVQQTITVLPAGTPVPVECETPVAQTAGTSGIVLFARVDNPAFAIDGDQQTGSTLVMPVGALGSSVFQQVNFTGLSNVGDTVRIRLSANGQLLSAGVLSSINVTTFKGTVSNLDPLAINSNLINLQLLSNGTEAIINFVPTAQFDGVEVKLNAGVLSALTSVNFNYARRIAQAPIVAAANVAICAGQTATLSVPAPLPGITYKWYDADGNDLNNNTAVFTTPVLTANTQYFVATTRGGCAGSRTAVNVTVTPAPLAPVLLSAAVQTCAGSDVTLEVQNPQTGVTYRWYQGSSTTPISGAVAATYTVTDILVDETYSVEAINICGIASAKTAVAITVGSLTAPVVNPQAITIVSGQTALLTASSATAGVIYNWYITDPLSPESTPSNGQNGTFFTQPLTATTIYNVTAQTTGPGGCTSPTSQVTVSVIPAPTNTGDVPCEAATIGTNTSGGLLALLARVDNPGAAVDADTVTSSTLQIPLGIGSYVGQKVRFDGASQIGDKVRIGISSSAGLLSLGVASSITVTTYNTNGTVSNNDEATISSQLITLRLLNGGTNAIIEFTPTQSFDAVELKLNSGLLSALTSVNFNYAQRIILPPTVLAATVSGCEGTRPTLTVANPAASGITYNWYKEGVLVATGATYQVEAGLAANTYNYSVAAVRGTCVSTQTAVTVTIIAAPDAPVPSGANPATTCLNTPVTLRVNPVANVTYNWYDAATGGNLLASNTASYIPPANLPAGTTNFYVEAINSNSCTSTAARTIVSLTIKPIATIGDLAVTGAEAPFCAGSPAVLTATSGTITNPVFTWYTDAALSNAVFTGPVYNIAAVNAAATYYVTVRGVEKCENTAGNAEVVTLSVNPPAVSGDINVTGITSGLCAGATTTLTATAPTVTSPVFTWYADAALTTVAHNGTPFLTGPLAANTTYYLTVSGTNKCENAAGDAKLVTIMINPPAEPADITVTGVPASTCAGSGASLTATSTTVINPVFTWYSDAALTVVVANGAVFNTDPLNANTTFYVKVSGLNKCDNLSGNGKEVVLSVNSPITFTGGALGTAFVATPYSVQISPATGGTPAYTYTLGSGSTLPDGLSLSAGGVINGNAVTPGTYNFNVMVIDSKGCTAVAAFSLLVTYPPLVLPPALLPDGVVGSVYPAQVLPAATGGKGPYTYAAVDVPAGLLFNPTTRQITGTPAEGGIFTIKVTVTDDNLNTATADYIINVTVPAPVVAGTETCAGTTVTLTVSNPVPGVTYNWYANASGGPSIGTGTTFQAGPINASTTYYAQGSSGTATSTRTAVTVDLKPVATTADITVTGVPATLCAGSAANLVASSTTVTNAVFTWYSDAALTQQVSNTATFDTPVLTANTTYYVTVEGLNKCQNTAATARVVVISVNPPIVFNGGTLPAGTIGNTYSVQLNPATGGTPGYSYTVASGSTLPDGLTLSSAGALTGTPTTQAANTFSVTAIDSKGCTTTAVFTLAVNFPPLVLPPATLPDGVVGTAYPVQTLPAATGGRAPYTYVATNLPAGISFNTTTRELTGTPTLGGTFTITVTVTDANSTTATADYVLRVTVPAPAVAGTEVCAGTRATLTVANPVANVTYNWYAAASGGNSIGTGTSFQTPVINATTTFYAEGSSGTAVSTRTAAVVTLKPLATAADITVTNASAVVCSGATTTLTATSTTVTNPVFTWYSDAALTVEVSNDATYITPALSANTTYYVTVEGSNKCKNAAGTAKVVVVTVNPAVVFNGGALAGATLNAPYSVQLNAATGGTPGYTYTLASGSTLPAGLSLSSSGVISGTPTAVGPNTFSVTATDSRGCNATAVFTITVNFSPLLLPPATLPDGVVGTAYPVQTLPAATGGKGPYTYVANNLPPGLTFNSGTREITGIPTEGGTFIVAVTVTDDNGNTANANYSIRVTVPAPAAATAQACAGSTVMLTVSNPVANVTYNWYTAASGGNSIGTGISFQTPVINAATTFYVQGASGTAVSTRTAVLVTLKQNATAADITITGQPAVVCSGSGASLTASSSTVSNPEFTWYSDAALTQVVSNDATFNTPVLNAATTYYVTVEGANKCRNAAGSARVVMLNVNPPIIFNGGTLAGATASRSYSVQLNPASGGTPGYTYTVTPGSTLPAGLSLAANGALSGIPTANGSYNFTVTATDTRGCTATASFALTIAAAPVPLSLPPATLPNGQVGTTYTPQTLPSAVGGTGPYTYVATGLPPGLSFNPITREITGTPTLGGTFTVTVTVTDASGTTVTQTYVIVVTVPAPAAAGAMSCPGSGVTLTVNNPVAGVTYNWYADASGSAVLYTGISFQTPVLTGPVSYYVEGASGMAVSTRIEVRVISPQMLATPVVSVQSSTFKSITFVWAPVDDATAYEVSTDNGATWSAPNSGVTGLTHFVSGLQANANVTLLVRAKGATACQTSAAGRFTGTANNNGSADGAAIFIPNTFTPNGDGKNDIFYVYGNAIVKVKMRVYNQWGQFLYQSLNLQNGWDGSYQGQMQPNGVYVYYVDLELTDGTKTMRKGTITLIR